MAGCILRFARSSPLRTTLVDEATGQAVYQIDTPIRLTGSVTRIRKLDSSTQPSNRWWEDDDDSDGSSATDEEKHHVKPKKDVKNAEEEDEVELSELPETSDEVARIYWRWFSTDKIVFRGKITTRDVFLPKCGKLRGSYVFTGPDGVQYRWALGALGLDFPKLVTADEKKTEIADFHRAHHFMKKQKARLEVQPEGMDMLDYIILTFVFAENKRRERETRLKTGHGGGGP